MVAALLRKAAGDGNVFGVGEGFIAPDGTSITAVSIPDELGGFQSWQADSATLNDSGSLEFTPGETTVVGPPGLFILDTHHGDVLRDLVLQSSINSSPETIAVDSTAQHVFMADSQGLTVLTLPAPPLAIGWLNPAIASTSGSTVITVRGSGFQTGTTVTTGGKNATSVYTDANTLQITAPANVAGAAGVRLMFQGSNSLITQATQEALKPLGTRRCFSAARVRFTTPRNQQKQASSIGIRQTIAGWKLSSGYFHSALHPRRVFDKIDVYVGSREQAA